MFLRKIVSLFAVVALGLAPALRLRADVSPPRIIINELLWMGSPSSSSDEWIELRNFEPAVVDLSGWKLVRRSSGSDLAMLTIPAGQMVEPGGYFLISNFADTSVSSDLGVVPDVVDPAVSLINSSLQVKLLDPAGTIVDIADDGSGAPLAGTLISGTAYASMARNGLAADGTLSDSWHTSTVSVNLKPGSLVEATPRAANHNVPPVIPIMNDVVATPGQLVLFDATDTTDPDGDPVNVDWNFGDGSTSAETAPSHSYESQGVFAVRLTASDGIDSATKSFSVTVSEVGGVSPVGLSGSATLSEIFPNPTGSDDHEFIEVTAENTTDLSGWKLVDASGAKYVIPEGTSLPSGGYLVFDRSVTKIALNNDEDTVTLMRPDGTTSDSLTFSEAEEGASYAFVDGQWWWTTKPTSGARNVLVRLNHTPSAKFSVSSIRRLGQPVVFDASDSQDVDGDSLRMTWDFGDGTTGSGTRVEHLYEHEGHVIARLTVRDSDGSEDVDEHSLTIRPPLKQPASKKSGSVKGANAVATIAGAQSAASSTELELNGWVTSLPGALGASLFYLSDGQYGISVHVDGATPKLKVGDAVTVHGVRRTASGEPYVLTSTDEIIIGPATESRMIESLILRVEDMGDDKLGMLVRVEGDVTSLSGSRFTVDDDSGEATVYVKPTTGFKRPSMRSGDHVVVSGIVSRTSSGIRILPRTTDDLRVEPKLALASPSTVTPASPKHPAVWAYGLVIAAVATAGLIAWRRKSPREI